MLGITLTVPLLGMEVFTGTFKSAAPLISPICLAVAEMPVFIPGISGTDGQIVATAYHSIANLLYYSLIINL